MAGLGLEKTVLGVDAVRSGDARREATPTSGGCSSSSPTPGAERWS